MSRSACYFFLHVFRLEGVVLCEGGSSVCGKIASICLKYTKPVQQVGATFTEYKSPHYIFLVYSEESPFACALGDTSKLFVRN